MTSLTEHCILTSGAFLDCLVLVSCIILRSTAFVAIAFRSEAYAGYSYYQNRLVFLEFSYFIADNQINSRYNYSW